MKHFIIVKFDDTQNIQDTLEPIRNLFNQSLNIEGVNHVQIHTSNTNRSNRHDLMIEMNLTEKGLEAFDHSEIHRIWKNEYGKYIVNKTIFDCD